ncbi:hypothetical protein [Atrimonas thermophila]
MLKGWRFGPFARWGEGARACLRYGKEPYLAILDFCEMTRIQVIAV